jgi:multidrug efflux pump subunit AcrA (membrane-fusion protein)
MGVLRTRVAGAAPLAMLALLALGLSACGRGPDSRYAAEPVARADVVERVSAPGSVQAAAQAELKAPANGSIKILRVRDGSHVKRGQVVAELASPQVDDAVKQAEAASDAAGSVGAPAPSVPTGAAISAFSTVQEQVSASTASIVGALKAALPQLPANQRKAAAKRLAEAQRRIDTAQRAARQAVAAAAGAAQAQTAAISSSIASAAAAQQAQADAALDIAREQQKRLTLKAPIAGTVQLGRSGTGAAAAVPSIPGLPAGADQALSGLTGGSGTQSASGPPLRPGSEVTTGQTVATILDVDNFMVAAEVDETDIALVKAGQPAEVELDAFPGVPFGARVQRVAITPSGTGGGATGGVSYQVDLRLGAPTGDTPGAADASPRVGMTATADVEVRTARDALSVPSSALVGRDTGQAVYVVEDGHVRLRPVQLAASGEDRIAISSGVQEGERVVTRGAERLRDGQEWPGA